MARELLERGRSILKALVDHRLIPLAKREHTGPDAHERILLVALLDERREPRAHRDVRALTDVGEQVFLDRDVGDFFVVEGLAH